MGDYELVAVQTIADVSSDEAAVTISVTEVVDEGPGDGDDEDESDDEGPGGGDGGETLPTLPDTGIDDGIAPALITAALLVMAGIGTRVWKRVIA